MRSVFALLLCLALWPSARAEEAPIGVTGAITVNVWQAKYLYDHGVVFIDVRPAREWGWGHVRGAVHLDLAGRFGTLALPHWPRQMPLVLYCDSDVCLRSALAAHLAVNWGYQQVFYFRSGYFAWQLLDYPQGKGQAGEAVAISAEER